MKRFGGIWNSIGRRTASLGNAVTIYGTEEIVQLTSDDVLRWNYFFYKLITDCGQRLSFHLSVRLCEARVLNFWFYCCRNQPSNPTTNQTVTPQLSWFVPGRWSFCRSRCLNEAHSESHFLITYRENTFGLGQNGGINQLGVGYEREHRLITNFSRTKMLTGQHKMSSVRRRENEKACHSNGGRKTSEHAFSDL